MSGMNNGVKSSTGYSVNLIGAGGIASWVLHGLVRPTRRFAQANEARVTIRVYDSDRVDDDNVHHQNFRPSDVGKAKVDALCDELTEFQCEEIKLIPCAWDVRRESDFDEADLTVIAVIHQGSRPSHRFCEGGKVGDMHLCRRLVHVPDRGVLEAIYFHGRREWEEGASCQLPGAISEGRIEAGNFAVAAVA